MKARINDISVTPVKKYAVPKYPSLMDASHAPGLLRKLPSRWEKNSAVVTAIGILGAMTLSSCGLLEPDKTGSGYNPGSENFLNVAPLFIHGGGTGSMGCEMIAPPVYLSEQEALAIIKSEAESGGLDFSAEPPDYAATSNKKIYEKNYSWERYPDDQWLGDGSVELDFYDGKTGVAVSYISMAEAQITHTETSSIRSIEEVIESMPVSWSAYPRELAEMTVEDFSRQKGDISVGVLYEPGIDWQSEEHQKILEEYRAKTGELWEKYYDEEIQAIPEKYFEDFEKEHGEANEEYTANIKALIEKDLREQVRDFIEWLQGQGII